MRRIIATMAILLTLGCGGAGVVKTPEKSAGEAPTEAAGEAAVRADDEAGAVPAGWTEYTNDAHGFSLLTPGTPDDISDSVKDPRIKVSAYQSLFKDESGMGQLMLMEFTGDQPFDVEAGLDGGCKQAVAGIRGTMDKYERKQDMGRSAREFEFSAAVGGENLKGFGRGFVLGPRKIGVVFAMYRTSMRAAGEAKARTYVSSFELK